MVHLLPLPGSPRFGGSIDEVVNTATEDAAVLTGAGFPALLVENFGDVPFHRDRVPLETVAAMTVAVGAVMETGLPVGVNVLRNDAIAALALAAATKASFIRVNVLTGTMYTDQGQITGRADEVQRTRARLCPEVEVWADVMVKHAVAPPGLEPAQAAMDTVERGMADAVIVSGPGTGSMVDLEQAGVISKAVSPGTRVVIGSGATADNLDRLLSVAGTVIVGSAIEVDGKAGNRPDPLRAKAFVEHAAERGLV
ncbi:MAG TPA: BtpA/SgcQ family protein [Acidimicrobiia bacterium]|jgi:membrane complex biogenesis BtpA family protein|nr:BtpA/SgcQ family protein [Acidimicrobiia bacterium]